IGRARVDEALLEQIDTVDVLRIGPERSQEAEEVAVTASDVERRTPAERNEPARREQTANAPLQLGEDDLVAGVVRGPARRDLRHVFAVNGPEPTGLRFTVHAGRVPRTSAPEPPLTIFNYCGLGPSPVQTLPRRSRKSFAARETNRGSP